MANTDKGSVNRAANETGRVSRNETGPSHSHNRQSRKAAAVGIRPRQSIAPTAPEPRDTRSRHAPPYAPPAANPLRKRQRQLERHQKRHLPVRPRQTPRLGARPSASPEKPTTTTGGRKTGASRPPAPENHGLNPGLPGSADTSALGGFLLGNIRINPTVHDSEKTRRPE